MFVLLQGLRMQHRSQQKSQHSEGTTTTNNKDFVAPCCWLFLIAFCSRRKTEILIQHSQTNLSNRSQTNLSNRSQTNLSNRSQTKKENFIEKHNKTIQEQAMSKQSFKEQNKVSKKKTNKQKLSVYLSENVNVAGVGGKEKEPGNCVVLISFKVLVKSVNC